MVTAVIVTILTIVVIACIALFAYLIYRHKKSGEVVAPEAIEHIRTYGVGTPAIKGARDASGADGAEAPDVHVKTAKESLKKPADKLTGRFTALGVLVAGVFATLGAKLWSMQLLGSAGYSSEAEDNLYTTVTTPASRGWIYDRTGIPLVKNKISRTVLADSDVADNSDVMRRLSTVLGLPLGVVRQRIKDESSGAQNQSIVASSVRLRDIAFISEHSDAFPGVSVEDRTVREYPYGALAAHVLGYTGSPTEDDLKRELKGRSIESADVIGKSGVELYYDSILSGDKGTRKMMVDASGNIVNVISETEPSKGSDLYLTIDAHAQYVADKLLAKTVAPRGDIGTGKGVSACIVGMDLENGGIVVLSSYPTFDPSYLADGIPQDTWELYNSEESHSPFMNRAINGQYAPASTFKAFTSMAGLNYGFATYDSYWTCTGKWDGFGSGDVQKCWDSNGHGTLNLHEGIVNSCDVVFYEIAKDFYDNGPDGSNKISETALQEYLGIYNFGKTTGIDLDGESSGLLPTPEWKAEQWRNVPSEAYWRGGDFTNMIIGQGDVLVTPLQLVCAYCGIATGRILKPHLLREVRNSSGDIVLEAQAEVVSEPDVNPDHLAYVRASLHDMLSSHPDLEQLYASKGLDVAAKSGTAEHTGKADDAWFAAYGPYDNPKYAVVCIVEQGGGGSEVSGPIVAEVLSALCGTDASSSSEEGSNDDNNVDVGYVQGSSGHSRANSSTSSSGRQD